MYSVLSLVGLVTANVFNTQGLLQNDPLNLKEHVKPEQFQPSDLNEQTLVTTTAAGTKATWSVFAHKSYSRYSLRVKRDVKLCDNVEQVS
jgi:hypothetical protein